MSARVLKPADFAGEVSVSRETLAALEAYAALLRKWQPRLNLVGPNTIADLWRRHMLDSAQIFVHLPSGPVLDAGSGAGFPGMVLAIMSRDDPRRSPVHLAESDARKCVFLSEVARATDAPAIVHNARVEAIAPFAVASIVSRALAPLDRLLPLVEPFIGPDTECFFLKGRGVQDELTRANKDWKMRQERIHSVTDPAGVLLHLTEVRRGGS